MAKKSQPAKSIEQYEHTDKERLNNPPVGLVNEKTDTDYGQNKTKYAYDPHLDPQLQWTGKAEHTSFEVPIVSLHVHERIDPKTIIDSVKKENTQPTQMSLFEQFDKPFREAVEFYKHKEGWTNRLVAGDSLLVMNSLLEKEGMAGKVQMIYFDPPYGIKYNSNFQPFTNKKDVTDGKDEDLTSEPEMIKAFRDTWELGIHSYLTYLRDRFLLAQVLLHDTGSFFIQISDENLHYVRNLLDEVFGKENFISILAFRTATTQPTNLISSLYDYIIWYGKKKEVTKFRGLLRERTFFEKVGTFGFIEEKAGISRAVTAKEKRGEEPLPEGKLFKDADITRARKSDEEEKIVEYEGKKYKLPENLKYIDGIERLIDLGRVFDINGRLCGKRYEIDNPYVKYSNVWDDTIQGTFELTKDPKKYVVQTNPKVIQRCLLMVTDPGDLVIDITCGSGTTAFVSEQWGRRWITCDTSRIALTLAKQRLMTSNYDYYKLARYDEGISSGFDYKTIEHKTIVSVAKNEPPKIEPLYDQPKIDNTKTRITGPFTVESIPAPFVKDFEGAIESEMEADKSVARSGETYRQDQWRDELLRTGVRAKGGAMMQFSRVEALAGTKYIQAQAETKSDKPEQVLVVFGPEHAPLEQRTVELAIEEARYLKPDILLFCAFQFDEEAAKDIDETPEKLVGFKLLKAQMNMDLQTDDLKKNRNTNQSFWLIGQPDVRLHNIDQGEDAGKVTVEVMGFDYFNPKTGNIDSGGKKNIAMWLLDTDYDGRSLFPKQVFFPMSGNGEGWDKLAKNLKADIDLDKIDAFNGTVSLPFAPGKLIAVKIIDDRGIESLKILKS